ncbi:dTDP-glucose 4,6-dehydratase [bacterium]|nr:dTDP-glucose 4,6-dehydratase [bacterium]RQV93726.1 MAG: dTDP-glucose 4,6-dehydratase [bacterium]
MKKMLVTGGAGFIGSHFIRYMLSKHKDLEIINLDKLTYAGNLENLKDIEKDSRYTFIQGDICDEHRVNSLVQNVNVILNFAAESHVDRSIGKPDDFIKTDIYGVFVLLEASKKWGVERFVQISTDEVYGSIENGYFKENDTLMPSSPYAASKAGGDRLAYSYYVTYGIPVVIPRSSNNFGPFQYPEKIVSLFITNALDDKKLPIYGDGGNVRDWLFVRDNCEAIEIIMERGKEGEVYNIGGGNERTNLELTEFILRMLDKPLDLKTFVEDRKGHDRRYALNTDKIKALGWKPNHTFENAMEETIFWYQKNRWWWERLKSGEFLEYYKKHYKQNL